MNRLSILLRYQFLLLLLLICSFSYSQIIINSGPAITPEDMVESILGEGIQFSNVTFQGAELSSGIFTNGEFTNLGIASGIFLCSGAVYNIPGPNESTSAGTNNGMPGNSTLDSISTSTTYDAAVLEFDFIPESDILRFKYVFGSEEYNEWINSSFNDVFGYFVSGPDPEGGYYANKNMAIVPGTTSTSVTINNVNNGWSGGGVVPTGPCENCEYYTDNTGGLTLEYDGKTTVLVAWLPVVPCEEYHILIGVADAGDGIYDTGIFIQENSIESPKIEVESDPFPQGVSDNMIEGCVEADIIFTLPNPEYAPITVYFEVGGTANPAAYPDGDFEEEIPTFITFEEDIDSAVIHVAPVKDGILEGEETLILIIENTLGCIVRYDTVEFLIVDYLDMETTMSPNTMICQGQQIEIYVSTLMGIPDYTYEWEGFSINNDTILVAPDTTTMYHVSVMDMCPDTVTDSTLITVFPLEILSFSFEAENNPGLPFDITGTILEDSVSLDVPYGTNLESLIASFNLSDGASIHVYGMIQESGITPNDFTSPVVYFMITPGGCMKEWTMNVNVVTGVSQDMTQKVTVLPNPAKDKITIQNASGFGLSMVNSLGAIVLQETIRENQWVIDVSQLKEGLYFLQFENNALWFAEKIVISH